MDIHAEPHSGSIRGTGVEVTSLRNAEDTILQELLSYRDDAYRLALRLTRSVEIAEEATQEAFLRVARAKGAAPPGADRRTWFLGMTLTMARNQMRSDRFRSLREKRTVATRAAAAAAPRQEEEIRDAVARACDTLDENLRMAVSLRYEQGLSFSQAAEILSVTESSVRVYVSRGIKALREVLARQGYAVAPSVIVTTLGTGFGIQAPPSLASALEHLAKTGQLPAGKVALSTAANSSRALWTFGALATGALTAGCAVWVLARNPGPPAAPTGAELAGVQSAVTPAASAEPAGKPAAADAARGIEFVEINHALGFMPADGLPRKEIALPAGLPKEVDFSFDGTALWISPAPNCSAVYKGDPGDGRLLKTITLEKSFPQLMPFHINKRLWGFDFPGKQAFEFDQANGRILKTYALPIQPSNTFMELAGEGVVWLLGTPVARAGPGTDRTLVYDTHVLDLASGRIESLGTQGAMIDETPSIKKYKIDNINKPWAFWMQPNSLLRGHQKGARYWASGTTLRSIEAGNKLIVIDRQKPKNATEK